MSRKIPILDTQELSDYRKEGVLVDRFSEYIEKHHDLVFPHRHNFYHFVIFTSASGTYSIDFTHFEARPWDVYFMIPGQIHDWAFEDGVDGYVINFNPDFFQAFLLRPDYLTGFSFLSGNAGQHVIHVPEGQRTQVKALCEDLIMMNTQSRLFKLDAVRVALLYLLTLFNRHTLPATSQPIPSYNHTLLRNFQQLIEKHYASLRLPKDYADMLFVTPNHLNALSKEFLGVQAGEAIRNRVLLEAKRLLVATDMSVSLIAERLNFNDSSYFTKFFKKSMHVTPDEFRRGVEKISS